MQNRFSMESNNVYSKLKHLGIPTDAMDLHLVGLNPKEDAERKLRALSCHPLGHLNLNRDQEVAIRSIEAAKSRALWFRKNKAEPQGIKFNADPPHLFWPQCGNDGLHPHDETCHRCLEAKEFFTSLGTNYARCVNDLASPAACFKVKPLCLQMVIATEYFKRHEISELAHHILEVTTHKQTSLEESYKNELKIWTRLNKYILQMKQRCKKYDNSLSGELKTSLSVNSFDKIEVHHNKVHIEEGMGLLAQCEKRIEEMAWDDEYRRILKNPKGFKSRVRLAAELFINRISNAAIMSDWISVMVKRDLNLGKRDYECMSTAYRSSPSGRLRNQYNLAPTPTINLVPFKSCNLRHWGSSVAVVTPYLQPPVSHLMAFTIGSQVRDIHPSWLTSSLLDSRTRKSLKQTLTLKNRELKKFCLISETEIHRGEIDSNMKSYFMNLIEGGEEGSPPLPNA